MIILRLFNKTTSCRFNKTTSSRDLIAGSENIAGDPAIKSRDDDDRSFSLRRCFTFLCVLITTVSTANTDKPVLAIQHWQTSQGTPVYFVRAPELPMVDVQIIFTAGSAYDHSTWGIAQLTANTLDEGTTQHNADQIAAAFDQVGAEFNSNASRDVALVSLKSLSDDKYLTPALQTFIEVLSQANFPEKPLARAQQQTLAAIQEKQQNPASVAVDAFYRELYGAHPYAHPILGTEKTVKALSRSQINDFYRRYYVSHNAKIVLVGNLEREKAEKMAEQLMSALPKGESAPMLTMNMQPPLQNVQKINFPSQQTTIIIGQLGMDRQNSQFFPLMVGNYLLGQMELGSILFQQIREQRGLAYGISSSFSPLTYVGPFAVTLQTRAAETEQALQVTQEALQEFIAKGPSDAQLQLAKKNLILQFPLNLATNEDIAATLVQLAINQRPLNYLDTYRDNINNVTAESVKTAFQKLIFPKNMLTILVGQTASKSKLY